MVSVVAFKGLPVCIRISKWNQVTDRKARRDHDQHDPSGIRTE